MAVVPFRSGQVAVASVFAVSYAAEDSSTRLQKLRAIAGVFALAAISISLHDGTTRRLSHPGSFPLQECEAVYAVLCVCAPRILFSC